MNWNRCFFFFSTYSIYHRTMKISKLIPKWVGFCCYSVAVLFRIYFHFFSQVIASSNNHKSTLVSQTNQKKEQKNWIIMLMTWQNKWDAICKVTAKRVSVHFVLACARICGECYVNHCHYYIMSKLYVISALLWNISETTDLVSSIECSANRNTRACLLALLTCWWCLCTCIMRMWLKIQQCIYILYLKWLP